MALTIRSPTLGPAVLALIADFFGGALASGSGAVSDIFLSGSTVLVTQSSKMNVARVALRS